MDINKINKKFFEAKKNYDTETMASCIMECCTEFRKLSDNNVKIPKEILEIVHYIDILPYATLVEFAKHNGSRAKSLIYSALIINPDAIKTFFYMHFILGMVHYEIKDYKKAEKYFNSYMWIRQNLWQDDDEIALFYMANTLMFEGDLQGAKTFYAKCLDIRKSFSEAADNLSVANSIIKSNKMDAINNLHVYIDKSLLDIDENDEAACFNIPIFINARDRVGVMRQQIDWLLSAGYTNIIILDNNSTYPPLMAYYDSFKNDSRVRVIYMKQNLGYKAIWKSGILEELDIRTPYVYTDPDIVPIDSCPKNILQQYLKILKQNPYIKKIGLGMIYDDITFYDKERWQKLEKNFYAFTEIAKDIYYTQVDTTFALYVNCRHYNLRFSMRTTGDMMAKHLPWYFDYDNLPEDEQYYLEHADKISSSIGTKLREDKNK